MDLALAYPSWLLALCALGAAALAWWTYGRTTPLVSGWRRGGLAALRFAALFLVLLLLFGPVWRAFSTAGDDPLLAVLVDESESLTLGAGPPGERARTALAALPADRALRFYGFAAEAAPVDRDSLAFDGPRTDIAAALGRIEQDFAGRNLRGVLLVSDGRVTQGRSPAALADRFPVPIFTAVTGDSASSRDVRLTRVVTNEVAYAGSPLPFRIGVRQAGYEGQTAPVTIASGGQVVARGRVDLPAGGAEATAELAVTPGGAGLRRYTVTVGPLAGEATTRNNSETVSVRVLDESRRVLLVGSGPSPDFTALRQILETDRQLDVTVRTQRSAGQFYEGPLPSSLATFDLLVLVGYPGRAADPQTTARLAEAAADGLATLFVLGRQTDIGRLGDAFGDVLPVEPARVRATFVEAGVGPTPGGETHPVLDEAGVDPAQLSSLPPLQVSETRWVLQPGARTLLAERRGGRTFSDPVVAIRQSGAVRSAAILGTGIWRWRTLPPDLDALSPVLSGLTSGMVRWTTAARDRRPVRIRADRSLFDSRERVTLSGEVYTEALQPVEDAEVALTIRGAGRTRTLPMRPVGNGRYVADAGALPPGSYAVEGTASRGGEALGTDRALFGVGEVGVEFREPGADVRLMRLLAERSGGETVPLDSLGAWLERLRQSGGLAARPVERVEETPLLSLPWLLALCVGLLTVEWVARKRLGMV
ncbi:MAG TPA: hypothetical protein EYQ24_05210 [Bacteroidetes bacterium]|nr:hypothetical protein [Bacteroidota bacterium]HIL58022.1 hypothetical protein [Rhodothermales bacterium]